MDRPLDGGERYFWNMSKLSRVHVMAIAGIRGDLPEGVLRRALDAAQARHPMLRVHVAESPEGPRLVSHGTQPLPLRVAPRPTNEAWIAEAEHELGVDIAPGPAPMMRVVLVRGEEHSEVIIVFHHLVGDGSSAFILFQDVFAACADLLAGKDAGLAALPELPTLSALLPPERMRASNVRVAREMLWWLRALLLRRPAAIPREGDAPPLDRRSKVQALTLDAESTSQLAVRARAEKATIQGALCAALLKALQEEIAPGKTVWLGCSSPVNLRPLLTQNVDRAFGLFGSVLPGFYRVGPDRDVWALAREVSAGIQRDLQRGRVFTMLAAFSIQKGTATRERRQNQAWMDAIAPAGVSNLGRLPLPPSYGPFTWDTFRFCGTNDGGGSSFGFTAGTFQDRMYLTFFQPEPLISRPRALRLTEGTMQHLRQAVASPPPGTPDAASRARP